MVNFGILVASRTNCSLISNISQRCITSLSQIPSAPPDRILGLTEKFNKDENKNKVNLTVGIYKDEWGQVTTFPSVARAQKIVEMDMFLNKDLSYLPITGSPEYKSNVLKFLFEESVPDYGPQLLQDDRISFIQTLSGTGAIAVTAKLISTFLSKTVWIPDPSWANHSNIFQKNGFTNIQAYSYYKNGDITVEKWLAQLRDNVKNRPAEESQCIVLHACCHNPTGFDPTYQQWGEIMDTIHELDMIPIIDMAYQGLESGSPAKDAYLLRLCLDESRYKSWKHGIFLCQSFAKNMGLYGERVGSLSVVLPKYLPDMKEKVNSQLKTIVRSLYSSPPGYGSKVASLVLSTPTLKEQWYKDVSSMVNRLYSVRYSMYDRLSWPGLIDSEHQHGMFYFTNLSEKQVELLRCKYAIYLTLDGRLSLSGINKSNIEYVCNAFNEVSKTTL